MTFDWRGTTLRVSENRDFLAFAFSQFLYGEVTGIQCGHWLYRAPDLDAAQFFARQATEELSHVRAFREVLTRLGAAPQKAHPVVRYLSSGMMPDSFAEHVALEMALGEGLVLMVMYALADTIDDPEIVRIIEAVAVQEERHVDFGERRTALELQKNPSLRSGLIGQCLVSLSGVKLLARALERRAGDGPAVLAHLPEFVNALIAAAELRLTRIGLLKKPLASMGRVERTALMARAITGGALGWMVPRQRTKLLTETYLDQL